MAEIDFAAETKALIDGVADCKDGMGPGCHCIQDIDARLRSIAQRAWQERAKNFTFNWDKNCAEIRADERRKWAERMDEDSKNQRTSYVALVPEEGKAARVLQEWAKRLRENS